MDVPPSPKRRAIPHKQRRDGSLQDVGKNFESLLRSTGSAVLSLADVARRLNTTPSVLRQYFRPFCEKLRARKPWYVDESATKMEELRRAVRTMTIITG
jgi:hypothetical protein